MKLGAEPKKVAIAIALLAVAGIVYWMNSTSDAPSAPRTPRAAADPVASVATGPSPADDAGKPQMRRQASGRASIVDNIYKPPASVDPGKVDPTLRLDLLAKVQSVDLEGGVRNLFQFSTEPVPQPAAPITALPKVDPIHPNGPAKPVAIMPPVPLAASNTPPPPAPINLKYYGYSTKRSDGERKAFFLDGEDIIVAAEGDIIKKQYKVVRISNTAVQMEDTTSKTTQTVPIQPDAAPV